MKKLLLTMAGCLLIVVFFNENANAAGYYDYHRGDIYRDRRDIQRDSWERDRALYYGNYRKADRLQRDICHDRRDIRRDEYRRYGY